MIKNITLFLIALFTFTISAQTVNIEGDPYGGNPYATINDAVAASTDANDVILITGVHTESVVVDKSLTLRGTDPTTDIIQAAASSGTGGGGVRPLFLGEGDYVITVENLGIRHGNIDNSTTANGNGGGLVVEKVTGQATLSNLIIEDNFTTRNGGAIGIAGSNVLIMSCTIRNNTASLDGGAIIAAPNNGSLIDIIIDIEQTLIDSNTGRNGGAFYLNGNNNFGNDFLMDVNITNSTVSNNNSTSPSGGNGGGAIWSPARPHTPNPSTGNISIKLVHATFYGNTHASLAKSGIRFGGAADTNFSAYNSIIVATQNDVTAKAINFNASNTTDVVNCILGGLENAGPFLGIIDDAAKNNQKGKNGMEAGLSTGTLSDEGGSTNVFAISENSTSEDFCTASVTGVNLPTVDQRGYNRDGVSDAGAFEFDGVLSTNDNVLNANVRIYPNPASEIVFIEGLNDIRSIKLYTILGNLVKEINNQNNLNVSDLSSGNYLISIESLSGNKITRKLIVN